MQLTEHFLLSEFNAHTAPWHVQNSLYLLCRLCLEPVRQEFGHAVRITSGYRSMSKNQIVGGVGDSQHLDGTAADFVVEDIPGPVVFAFIRDKLKWPGELLYYAKRGHIHVALPRYGTSSDIAVLNK